MTRNFVMGWVCMLALVGAVAALAGLGMLGAGMVVVQMLQEVVR